MGISCFWDTNTIIYYLHDLLPAESARFCDEVSLSDTVCFSVITEIELLSWGSLSSESEAILRSFIRQASVIGQTEEVKEKAIEIRKKYKLKLPDAIIAASAICEDAILLTRDVKDFSKVKDLKYRDIWV